MKVSHVSPFVDVEKLGCVILLSKERPVSTQDVKLIRVHIKEQVLQEIVELDGY